MRKEDINLSLHNGSLSVSGERKNDQEFKDAEVYRAERFLRPVSADDQFACSGSSGQNQSPIQRRDPQRNLAERPRKPNRNISMSASAETGFKKKKGLKEYETYVAERAPEYKRTRAPPLSRRR